MSSSLATDWPQVANNPQNFFEYIALFPVIVYHSATSAPSICDLHLKGLA